MALALFALLIAAALIAHYGTDAVGGAVTSVGWRGLAMLCAAHCAALVFRGLAWHQALAPPVEAGRRVCVWACCVRDGMNNVVGIIPASGEFAAARELALFGARPVVAAASAIVDLTAELVSQILFTCAGIGVLFARGSTANVTLWLAGGVGVSAALILTLLLAQRRGLLNLLETLPKRLGLEEKWAAFSGDQKLHDAVERIYAEPWRLPASIAFHLLGWVCVAFEAWLALGFMGRPVSFADALALESLVYAARSAAFFVPWAAGVQEGGYVFAGALLGIPPAEALAVSVLKRAREWSLGAPSLLAWQLVESRRMARQKSS